LKTDFGSFCILEVALLLFRDYLRNKFHEAKTVSLLFGKINQ